MPSVPKKCVHGKQKRYCQTCGGGGLCQHGKLKPYCKSCGGSSICEHGKQKHYCKSCGGSSICEHGKQKHRCKSCGGSSICEHGKEKHYCKSCGGAGICEHGKVKHCCKSCGGAGICEHGKRKHYCKSCGGAGICEHGKVKHYCKSCGGAGICEHGKNKHCCKSCGGSSICEHGKVKHRCKSCGGAGICEHGKRKQYCKSCGGAGICEHGKDKHYCKSCGGAGICEHGKLKQYCKSCDGGGICEHGTRKTRCRICNTNHPYHNIPEHHGRASDFEHLMIEAMLPVIPPWSKTVEQFPVDNPASDSNFRIDLVVELSSDFLFAVEFDGTDHYPDGVRKTLGDSVKQLKRDRYVEQWCLEQKMSCFRVPYTCLPKGRRRGAVEYIIAAAMRDYEDNVARVHYLDYESTYADINEFAVNNHGVGFVHAIPYTKAALDSHKHTHPCFQVVVLAGPLLAGNPPAEQSSSEEVAEKIYYYCSHGSRSCVSRALASVLPPCTQGNSQAQQQHQYSTTTTTSIPLTKSRVGLTLIYSHPPRQIPGGIHHSLTSTNTTTTTSIPAIHAGSHVPGKSRVGFTLAPMYLPKSRAGFTIYYTSTYSVAAPQFHVYYYYYYYYHTMCYYTESK
eukprot:3940687-Rhodomonas_salina.1